MLFFLEGWTFFLEVCVFSVEVSIFSIEVRCFPGETWMIPIKVDALLAWERLNGKIQEIKMAARG